MPNASPKSDRSSIWARSSPAVSAADAARGRHQRGGLVGDAAQVVAARPDRSGRRLAPRPPAPGRAGRASPPAARRPRCRVPRRSPPSGREGNRRRRSRPGCPSGRSRSRRCAAGSPRPSRRRGRARPGGRARPTPRRAGSPAVVSPGSQVRGGDRQRGPEPLAACLDEVGRHLVQERVVAETRVPQALLELREIFLAGSGGRRGPGCSPSPPRYATGPETDSSARAGPAGAAEAFAAQIAELAMAGINPLRVRQP